MFKDFKRLVYVCMAFVMAMVFSACGGGGGGGVAGSGTTGTLSLGLTDVPGDYLNVFVTIDEVQVNHETEGWETLTGLNLPQTFDLMTLQNGVIAPLGAVDIEAGHYNQMRLILSSDPGANYLVIEGEEGEPDEEVDLKVPSGLQTGIKIVQGFDIEVAGSTELTLDFNAEKSIVQAGKSGKWLLKPTIKVLETITFSVSGVVTALSMGLQLVIRSTMIPRQTLRMKLQYYQVRKALLLTYWKMVISLRAFTKCTCPSPRTHLTLSQPWMATCLTAECLLAVLRPTRILILPLSLLLPPAPSKAQ
jgi:hypothetical protein